MQPSTTPFFLPTLAAANFAVGVGSFITIGILTPMSADLNMTAAEAGFVMTIYAIAYAIGSPLMVAATGALARRSVLGGGLLLMALASVISALAETPEVLFISRAIAALGGGVITPVVAGVAAANSPPEKRGSAMALTFFGLSFAQVLGMPACAWVGYTFGWEVAFWVSTGLALVAAALVFLIIPAKTAFQANSLWTLLAALGDLKSVFAVLLTSTMMGSMYIVFTYIAPILENGMGFGRDGVSPVSDDFRRRRHYRQPDRRQDGRPVRPYPLRRSDHRHAGPVSAGIFVTAHAGVAVLFSGHPGRGVWLGLYGAAANAADHDGRLKDRASHWR